ncbi:hypothetical protein BGX38DRAFT_373753 [Terfezia claveryi]|nr:hypothetical protein BGX38DRAFT_373753 [Terfezia claveryi]
MLSSLRQQSDRDAGEINCPMSGGINGIANGPPRHSWIQLRLVLSYAAVRQRTVGTPGSNEVVISIMSGVDHTQSGWTTTPLISLLPQLPLAHDAHLSSLKDIEIFNHNTQVNETHGLQSSARVTNLSHKVLQQCQHCDTSNVDTARPPICARVADVSHDRFHIRFYSSIDAAITPISTCNTCNLDTSMAPMPRLPALMSLLP